MRRSLLILAALALPAVAFAQLPIPDIPGIDIPIPIPGLDNILKAEPPVTTSIDDAKTDAPFLDDFDPAAAYPMAQLPITPDASYIMVAPGVYELDGRSYCLNAGAHGPGEGDGYLYAPLQGPWSGIIRNILRKSYFHGDIPQSEVQTLIWAILARTKINDLSGDLQGVARQLLTAEEIATLNGGALGLIPDQLRERAFEKLPPFLRQVLEAQAELRQRLTGGAYSFEELEEIAVLTGAAPEQEGDRDVPWGRWSYHPDGFFIRYFTYSYSHTRTQLYVPEPLDIGADDLGRITSIADSRGNRIELAYDDTIDAATVTGDDGLRAYAFRSIRFLTPGGDGPAQAEWTDRGWTFVGTLSGQGRPAGDAERFDGLADRYQQAAEHRQQLTALVQEIQRRHPDALSGEPLQDMLADITDVGHCALALRAALGDDLTDEAWRERPHLSLLQRAWATGVCGLAAAWGQEAGAGEQAHRGPQQPLRLAALQTPPGLGYPTARPADGVRLAFGGKGGWGPRPSRPKPRPLPDFDPSGGTGAGSKSQQPTGQSPKSIGEMAEANKKAQDAIWMLRNGKVVAEVISSPAMGAAKFVGFGIPNFLFGKILDFNFCKWAEATAALAGQDPARGDYTIVGKPEPISFEPLQPGPDLPAERAAALNALMTAACNLTSQLRAGSISLDRMMGAWEAGDEFWTRQQAAAMAKYKQASGAAMVVFADRLDDVVRELRAEGFVDINVTADSIREYQQRLRAEGFSQEALAAARTLGLTDEEIEAELQERLAADPDEVAGSLFTAAAEVASALRELGPTWAALPSDIPDVVVGP